MEPRSVWNKVAKRGAACLEPGLRYHNPLGVRLIAPRMGAYTGCFGGHGTWPGIFHRAESGRYVVRAGVEMQQPYQINCVGTCVRLVYNIALTFGGCFLFQTFKEKATVVQQYDHPLRLPIEC